MHNYKLVTQKIFLKNSKIKATGFFQLIGTKGLRVTLPAGQPKTLGWVRKILTANIISNSYIPNYKFVRVFNNSHCPLIYTFFFCNFAILLLIINNFLEKYRFGGRQSPQGPPEATPICLHLYVYCIPVQIIVYKLFTIIFNNFDKLIIILNKFYFEDQFSFLVL